ncbi:unnamed protein product [Pseudo-nitzschia multistriata]|uniref:Potassium channel domain-containing protein n=1 Tax=Pseudo-nitzschia multistriata TaxID=183589 RepID=A0A448ZME9_9STRA|nr:unnamed protein product [Pseudo-nitzschia multistriata]
MARRSNRFAEEFPIAEEEAEDGGQQVFERMRAPLLSSSPSFESNNSNNGGGNLSELRHRSTTLVSSSAASGEDEDGDVEGQYQLPEEQFQPQQQRILDRNGMFRQSKGRLGVERRLATEPPRDRSGTTGNGPCRSFCRWYCWRRRIYQEWGKDWFFWLAYKKTAVLFLLLFCSYALIICFFGFIYLSLSIFGSKAEVNPDGSTKTIAFCDMDINDHMEAMYFSLSTMTTIGYGVSDYYFGGCYSPLLIVLMQICTAIVFDAVAVGLIFHRISRGAKRSRSILFSDKAIVRNVRGVPHLMFRLGERRKHHLIEATVRCYCIRHERIPQHPGGDAPFRIETTSFVSRQMRLLQPDDRFGSHLWMGLPQVVVHRIDETSPLCPSAPLWFDVLSESHRYPPPGGGGTGGTGSSNNGERSFPPSPDYLKANEGCIKEFLYDRDVEVVVLVDGTDEGTGAATQARHSYKLCDMTWNHRFAECVHPYSRRQRSGPSNLDPVVSIDFSAFHDTTEVPLDCEECAYVPKQ